MKRATRACACVAAALVCGTLAAGGTGNAPARPVDLRALVHETSRDLTRLRGATLKEIPPAGFIAPERYVEEYVIKTMDLMWGGDFDRSLEAFKALGMLPAELDAKPFLRRYGAAMTAAAYDFLGKRILFPRRRVSRDVLLHELVHAMQDERHDIKRLMLTAEGNLDRTLAMGALIEGEATNVQLRYSMGRSRVLAGLTPYGTLRKQARARAERIREQLYRVLPNVPPNLIRAQAFVYGEGVLFVERLRRRKRHWAAVDAAYLTPPQSTSQILHPEKYITGEWPVALSIENPETFVAGYELVTENTLGEFGMRLFLETHLPNLEGPEKAVEGWRGDRAFLYRDKRNRPVLLWLSTWETPEKAEQMRGLLLKALTKHVGESFKECVRAKRREHDVVAVLSVLEPFERLLDPPVTKKTIQGRPFGDEKENTTED